MSLLIPGGWAQTFPAPLAPEFRTVSQPQITGRVDPSRLLPLRGAEHPAALRAQDLGAVEDSLPIEHIQLALRRTPERQTAFDALVQALQDPGNPSFHRWLTPEQVGAEFGASASDVAALASYLQSEGFTVNGVSRSQMWVDFTGSAATVQHSFHTGLHRFRAASGEVYTSAAGSAEFPAALMPAISGLVSLGNFPFHAQRRVVPEYAVGSTQSVGAQDFYTIYNELPLFSAQTPISGAGQTIALIEETDINPADVTAFRSIFGVSPAAPALTMQHGSASVACAGPGVVNTAEEGEAVLDTEWAGAVAPGASLLLMSCANSQSTAGILLAMEAAVEENFAGTLSLSYGGSELGQTSVGNFVSSLYEQAAAQGQTVVVSSGDSGSDSESDGSTVAQHGLNVNVLGSSAYNISAGGTDFQDRYNQTIDGGTSYGVPAFWNATDGIGQLTAKSYIPETTWNDTCASSLLNAATEGRGAAALALCEDASRNANFLAPVGGSGGQSIVNARPSWQTGTVYGLPSTGAYSGRLLPDISLFASNGFWGHAIYFYQSDVSSSPSGGGGTSFVAPQLAGVFALVAQKTGARVGLANVQLYALAGHQFGTSSYAGSTCNGSGASGIGETSSLPSGSCVFYDIQTGNNALACRSGTPNCFSDSGQTYGLLSTSASAASPAFSTGAGYDLATGIGSLNIANLVNSWAAGSAASSTTLSLSRTSFPLNTSVTFTSTVAATSGSGTPTGTVQLVAGAAALPGAAATLSGGTGRGSTSNLPGGTYAVYAKYLGDLNFAASTSPAISITVTPQSTDTALTVTPASAIVYGSTVSLTATLSPVSAGSFSATGTIAFRDAGTNLCNAVPINTSTGVATCTCPALSAGSHNLTAIYIGDTNFASSTSVTQAITISTAVPVISFAVPSMFYRSAPFTIAATSTSSGAFTYTVVTGPATINGSTVTLTGIGTVVLAASEAASGNYASAAQTTTFTVTAAAAVWLGNANNTLSAFSLSGTALSPAGGLGGGGLGPVPAPLGMAFDATGKLWIANSAGSVSEFSSTGAPFAANPYTAGGINHPSALAVDGLGQVWIENGNGSVTLLANTGAALSPSTGFTGAGLSTPGGLAVDVSGNVWVANTSDNSVTEILGAAAPVAPLAVAVANGTTGARP